MRNGGHVNGESYIAEPIDLTGWHAVEPTHAYKRGDFLKMVMVPNWMPSEAHEWCDERQIEFQWGIKHTESETGHRIALMFYFPPHEANQAMLFKLTFGGQ